MPSAKYQIPDSLNVNTLWGSKNSHAYTKISSYTYGSSTSTDSVWLLPIPTQLSYGSEFRWSAEELHQVAGGMIDSVMHGVGKLTGNDMLNERASGNSLGTKSLLEKGGFSMLQKASRDFISNKMGAENSGAVWKEALKTSAGVAYNPNEQLYFDGVSLRDFDMEFQMAPTDASNAADIKSGFMKLIQKSSPDYAAEKFFFTYPSYFNITVVVGNVIILERKNLAITSVLMSMNPNGPLTWHDDGFPTTISCNISFKETEIPTKSNIKKIKVFGSTLG